MMSRQRYHDQGLDNSSQIRLVSIVPRQDRKRIHLKLESVSTNEVEGQYDVISYRWGSQSNRRNVVVNGKTLALHDNIWRCLKHIREHELTKAKLWIDSICINQIDEKEKTAQVAKMAQIFRNASQVLVWLGSTSTQTYLFPTGTEKLQDSIENLPSKDIDAWIDVLGHSDGISVFGKSNHEYRV